MNAIAASPQSVPPAGAVHLHGAWSGSETLCNRCGFCLPVCPTYRETGMESASPRGRLDLMYAVARGELTTADIAHTLDLCLGCRACETACPAGIAFGHMYEAGRIDAAPSGAGDRWARRLSGNLLNSPRLLGLIAWNLALYQRSGLQWAVRTSHILAVWPWLRRLEAALPPLPLPPLPFTGGWRRRARRWGLTAVADDAAQPGAHVDLFAGCVMDVVFGETHLATVQVLHAQGFATRLPGGQGCCGALQLHSGDRELTRRLARVNIAAFDGGGPTAERGPAPERGQAPGLGREPIVVNSAGCGALMKDYGALLADDPSWAERARAFAARVVDVSEFLARTELRPPPHEVRLRVAYDDPCHLVHAQRIREAPRKLLQAVPGLELVELPEADWCCGSAGTYSLQQPAMAERVLQRKMAHIAAAGVDVVATGNPGCLLQLAAGAQRRGLAVRIVHPIELLARAYTGEDAG